jgi:hypothetical protein
MAIDWVSCADKGLKASKNVANNPKTVNLSDLLLLCLVIFIIVVSTPVE